MVIRQMDEGGFDLVILDGEATPAGGMGIAKQLKDEIADCPPILVLTGRAGRRMAGQLVARRGRGSPPDRPDPFGRRRGVAAARARAVVRDANYPAALAFSRHANMAACSY